MSVWSLRSTRVDVMRPTSRRAARACLCAVWLACAPAVAAAQETQAQIDRDVWIPFLAASTAFDAEKFLAVQSKDLIRVAPDRQEIYGLPRYAAEIRQGFPRAKQRGVVRRTEMRFLTRTAAENLAHETGFFRSEVTLATGEKRVQFARFEMVLRREDGAWRILLDKDTSDGGAITEEMFRAAPMAPGQ